MPGPGGPLWRAAPARLLRAGAWGVLVAVAVSLVAASAAAPGLFAEAADRAALTIGLRAVDADAFAAESTDLRAGWEGVMPVAGDTAVREALAGLPSYADPVLSATGLATRTGLVSTVFHAGRSAPSTLFYRDGAVAALGGDPHAPGVWLAEDVADAIGARAGDRVSLGLVRASAPRQVVVEDTVLAGTYPRIRGSALPRALADSGIDPRDLPWDRDRPGVGSPLAVVGRAEFGRLALAIGEEPLFTTDLVLDRSLTPAQARAAAAAVEALRQDAVDTTTPVGQGLASAKPEPAVLSLSTGLPDIIDDAEATSAAAQVQVRPFVTAGLLLALALVAASVVLLGRSRRHEEELLVTLGVRPVEAGALVAVEVAAPALLAGVVGVGAAWTAVTLGGPPAALPLSAVAGAVPWALLAAGGGVLVCALTAAVAAWAGERRWVGSTLARGDRRRVPWEPMLLVVTLTAAVAVLTESPARRPYSTLAALLPVLVVASVAVLVTGVLRAVGRRRRPGGRPGSARWLAAARARDLGRELTALTLVIAVGLGVLGYVLAVRRGVVDGVADKVAALAGAETLVEIGPALAVPGSDPRFVPSPLPDSTLVWRQQLTMPPAFGTEQLMAIDPRDFAEVADWGRAGGVAQGRDLIPELVADLETNTDQVPVLLAGETDYEVGDTGLLNIYDEWQAPFTVVGVVPAFPGSEAEPAGVTVIASARTLFPILFSSLDPRLASSFGPGSVGFSSWLWSARDSESVRSGLRDAGIDPLDVVVREYAERRPELTASRWATGYLLALGVCALVLTAAAALVLAVGLADRDAVADVLLRRMSFRRGDLTRTRVWELGYAVALALAAGLLAVLVLALAPTLIEPVPAILPLIGPRVGWPELAGLVLLSGVLVLAGGAAARARAARRTPAEVLRGDG